MKKIYIDGSNLIHRSHWVSKNANLSSVYLFLASVKKYCTQFESTDVYIAWDDRRDQQTANHRRLLMGRTYKGTRDKEKNTEAFKNADNAAKMTSFLGIKNLYPNILEADDIIAWLVKYKFTKHESVIISTDQDLLQLINENTCVYNPIKDIIIDIDNFEEITNVPLSKFVEHKAVMGDKSDNITGIPGAGPKRALKIVCETGISNESQDNQDIVTRNMKMMSLDYSLKHNDKERNYLNEHVEDVIKTCKIDFKQFENGCKYFNMINIMKKIQDWKHQFSEPSTTVADIINNIDLLQGFDK